MKQDRRASENQRDEESLLSRFNTLFPNVQKKTCYGQLFEKTDERVLEYKEDDIQALVGYIYPSARLRPSEASKFYHFLNDLISHEKHNLLALIIYAAWCRTDSVEYGYILLAQIFNSLGHLDKMEVS